MTNDIHSIITTMEQKGGAFAQSLAKAMRAADPSNLYRVIGAFPDFIERYDELTSAIHTGGKDHS